MSNAKFIIGETGGQIDLSISPSTPSAPSSGYVSMWTDGQDIYMVNSAGTNILVGGTGAAGTSGTSGINGTSGTSGINGTSGTSGINGTSGTSGVSGTSGTSGVNGLGLLAKNIGLTGGQFTYVGSPDFIVYRDIVFDAPFASTNYSIDVQWTSAATLGTNYWADLSVPGANPAVLSNKTTSGFRLEFQGISAGTFTTDAVVYVQCIALGETGVPTQGPAGPTGAAGTSGTSGVSGSSGTDGTSGTSGTSGVSGSSGTDGTSGTSGINGTSGTSGNSALGYLDSNTSVTLSQSLVGTSQNFNITGRTPLGFNLNDISIGSVVRGYGGISFDNDYWVGAVNSVNNSTNTVNIQFIQIKGTITNSSWSIFLSGLDGLNGATGATGISGTSGTSGTSGINGPTGPTGSDTSIVTSSTKTADHTLALADVNTMVIGASAAALTFTVPLNSTTAFVTGSQILVTRGGTGALGITGAAGVTLNSAQSYKQLNYQYSAATLVKQATDTWYLFGDLKA